MSKVYEMRQKTMRETKCVSSWGGSRRSHRARGRKGGQGEWAHTRKGREERDTAKTKFA